MSAKARIVKRLLLGIWCTLCGVVLIFAIIQRDIHDMDIAYTYFMLFLTFPAGLIVAAVLAALFTTGLYLPGGLTGAFITWPPFVILGYLQWFVLLPWVVRRLRQTSNRTVERDARKSSARLSP
jgi:type VI protein secretion system component VasK